jgi:hypothetical protein
MVAAHTLLSAHAALMVALLSPTPMASGAVLLNLRLLSSGDAGHSKYYNGADGSRANSRHLMCLHNGFASASVVREDKQVDARKQTLLRAEPEKPSSEI